MKEKIYTIPINEAFDSGCSCPLCSIEKKLEADAVEYALGAAMMEPDYRILSNEKGYCRHHFSMLKDSPNKLSLALVLETHLDEITSKLSEYEKSAAALGKQGLFKKSSATDTAKKISDLLQKNEQSCVICEKTNKTIERYCRVLLYMWENDEAFRSKFGKRKICLKHSRMLFKLAPEEMRSDGANEFIKTLYGEQLAELRRRRELVHKFTLKFDYRYRDMELGEARTAVADAIELLCGYIDDDGE